MSTDDDDAQGRYVAHYAARQAKLSREVAFVELSANAMAGRVKIGFGRVDDGSLLRPEEWLPRAESLWEPLLGIVGTLAGHDRRNWILSRVRSSFNTSRSNDRQPFPGHVGLERTILGIAMPPNWASIECLIVLREWILVNDIDDDIVHVFVTPHREHNGLDYFPEDHGAESTKRAEQLATPLGDAVGGFLSTYLGDPGLEVAFGKPKWENENAPIYGLSSYEYVGAISEGSSTSFAKNDDSRSITVFMCHGSEDKAAVRALTGRLRATDFITCWFDEDQILPGQDWELEIARGVAASDAILVCLSTSSSTRRGYVQKEIKKALDLAQEQPEGSIFVIPIRLDDCLVPDRLRDIQWVDLFESGGVGRLLRALASVRLKHRVD